MSESTELVTWNELFPAWPNPIHLPESFRNILGSSPRSKDELDFAVWCDQQPKIELHVHMEAAVSESFYQSLNSEYSLFKPEDIPSRRAPFSDFRQFIRAWIDQTLLINRIQDISALCADFFESRRSLNIVYTEAHVSPLDFSLLRSRFSLGGVILNLKDVITAYVMGIKNHQSRYPGHIVRLIIDCEWISTVEEQAKIVDILSDIVASELNLDCFGDPIILAVGLGGAELSSRSSEFLPLINSCREMGLKIDIHSGEVSKVEEHRFSVETLKPDRVGHGMIGQKAGYFAPCPIVVCPLSNMISGAWSHDFKSHPITEMFQLRQPISIGSDDPLLFGTSLVLEFVALFNAKGWAEKHFEYFQKNASESVFCKTALDRVRKGFS
jgi:adenosine deaminase